MAVISCKGCQQEFSSKNQLFRHLSQTAETCLPPSEHKLFLANVLAKKREKIGVLYGYLPGTDYRFLDHASMKNDAQLYGIEGGQHAAWLVTQAIARVVGVGTDRSSDKADDNTYSWSADAAADSKFDRSYGHISRNTDSTAQDEFTGAITEVLTTTAMPLFATDKSNGAGHNSSNANGENNIMSEDEKIKTRAWVSTVNSHLEHMLSDMSSARSRNASTTAQSNELQVWHPGRIRVFGRVVIALKKFKAEADVTHRRIDYCLPADMLFASNREGLAKSAVQPKTTSLQEFCNLLPSFPPGNTPHSAKTPKPVSADDGDLPPHSQYPLLNTTRPRQDMLTYLYETKKIMKRIATQVEELDGKNEGDVLEKEFHDAKRKKKKMTRDAESYKTKDINQEGSTVHAKEQQFSSKNFLKRKRFHNFCPLILAHNSLAYRRVDRIYHRATIRLEGSPAVASSSTIQNRPFIVFSLTGDTFLQEQAVRIIGLLVAICRGVIDDDIIDCMFDEEFVNLVPAPPALHCGLLQGEAQYMAFEGKMKTIMNARRTDRYSYGFGDEDTVAAVEEWERLVLNDVANSWYWNGEAKGGRLRTETHWIENVLYPWAEKTQHLLEDYRGWKASKALDITTLESIDTIVPPLFEKVLFHLREADKSGMWPSTSPNRQLVMLSTSTESSQVTSLSVAYSLANKKEPSKSCAYAFKEGEGGASGSFSVGAMPEGQSSQPKANMLFPELVKAAFELEIALFPNRDPSSTIAINRNAQFRPHTDSGAGAGQSTSLIVGIGNYVGGELVVEGTKEDIRYKAVEFDGWKQRHWTLPFQGERYSLVWFTPKGCEGIRGIDLKL